MDINKIDIDIDAIDIEELGLDPKDLAEIMALDDEINQTKNTN